MSEQSPEAMPERTGRKGRRWALGLLGGLVVAAGAAYGVGYSMAGDKLPRNATVSGVAIGAVDEQTATQRLTEALTPKATAPITLSSGAMKAQIVPAESGMGIDYAATVRQAGAGRSLDPRHMWTVLRGGGELSPVVRVDQAKLAQVIAAAAPSFATKPVDATLTIAEAKPVTTPGKDGTALDQIAAVTDVRAAYLSSNQVPAKISSTPPQITTEAVKKVVDEQLTPALSGLVTIKGGDKSFTIGPRQISAATTLKPANGTYEVTVDGKKLFALSEADREKAGLTGGKDARWTLAGGKPTLVPAVDGQGLKEETFTKLVVPALFTAGANRSVAVPVEKVAPKVTTEMAKKAPVTAVTGEFTTEFPFADYRNTNLSIAAARVNNTYIAPGETFSMNDTIGPRDAGSGFVDGWVIAGDHLVKENAGGISQSGTTVYNALFFSGLEHVEHQPHTMYFDRYPAGREATLYYGSIDVKFKNDSPYGAIMQAYVNKATPGNKGSITVKVWSTKVYDKVESTALNKTNFTKGRTIHRSGSTCHAQAAAPGFTVNYSRLFYKGGAIVKREPYSWTYSPTDEIICD